MKRLAMVCVLSVLAAAMVFGQEEESGEQGPAGQQGPSGEQGPTGQQGPSGEQGPTGQQGPSGEQGPTGQQGPSGEQGEVLEAEFPNQIWTYDLLEDVSASGQQQVLFVVDEFTHECLAFEGVDSLEQTIQVLNTLVAHHGTPQFLRNHKNPEFVAPTLQDWLVANGIQAF